MTFTKNAQMMMVLSLVTLFQVRSTSVEPLSGNLLCDGIAAYRLDLEGRWSEDVFHKQYPTYRPPAQWSKLIGRTHSDRYILWAEGQLASNQIRQFAENNISHYLDAEPQGNFGIFDSFQAPSITSGVGQSTVKFLAHPHHSKMSFIVRIIPSPDWFVGISSLDLCTDGHWLEFKQLELDPMDAGTDRGLTFTAPNWQEAGFKNISRITSKWPNHGACPFFYPELENLPPIAVVNLTKVDLPWNDTSDFATKKPQVSLVTLKTSSKPVLNELDRMQVDNLGFMEYQGNPRKVVLVGSERSIKPPRPSNRSPVRRKKIIVENADGKNDCEVSNWGNWSACSKTCGFGQQLRTRKIVRRARNGGRMCPVLREEQMCGSMRGCGWQHFSQDNWDKDKTPSAGKESATSN